MLKEDDLHCEQVDSSILEDFTNKYTSENKKLKKLENDFDQLQTSLSDKEKIIGLYEFMLNGDAKANIRLQDQDIIKVGSYKNRVELKGQVKREGLFEITKK
jgi:protein involved in polysaccharide export with SLBB domain